MSGQAPVTFTGKIYKWRSKTQGTYWIWAEDGVILIENQDSGEFQSFVRFKAREVFSALGDIAATQGLNATGASGDEAAWERTEARHNATLVECLRAAFADATAQGDPTDEDVKKWARRDGKKAYGWKPAASPHRLAPAGSGPGGAVVFTPQAAAEPPPQAVSSEVRFKDA